MARMRVLNADGSEAEMCGNGLRCVAKYLFEEDLAKGGQAGTSSPRDEARPTLDIETGAGVLRCELPITTTADGNLASSLQGEREIEIAMGAPRLQREAIPMLGPRPSCSLMNR